MLRSVQAFLEHCFKWLFSQGSLDTARDLVDEGRSVSVQLVTLGSIQADFILPASTKVFALRHRVAQELGIPAENQRLILGSTVLDLDLDRCLGDLDPSPELLITVLRRRRQEALSAGSLGGFLLWDLENRDFSSCLCQGLTTVHCMDVDWHQVQCLAGQSCQLQLWHLGHDRCLGTYDRHLHVVVSVSVQWEQLKVLSCCKASELHFWNLSTFDPIAIVQVQVSARCMVVDWSAGKVLTSGGQSCTLWTVDATLSKVQEMATGDVAAVSLQWPRSVLGGTNGLRLWTFPSEGSESFRSRSEAVVCLSAAWDAERLVSGSVDGTLRLWSLATR
eukprot:symbB.v1.2.037702.t1/scaffold5640.1/size25837/2